MGLAALIDEWAHGVVVTNLEGLVLHANPSARLELKRQTVLGVSNRSLAGNAPEHDKSLRRALSQAGHGNRSLLTLASADGLGLTLAVVPLRSVPDSKPDCAGLVFARSSICEAFMLCFFARSHGLTRKEELVLGILVQGYSAPEIAQQMSVAVSTVRSHVRSLCYKTRSSGVRELVKRVAVLPPVAAALGLGLGLGLGDMH